jgi:drug/metabolite transporter (DMT)-like permease
MTSLSTPISETPSPVQRVTNPNVVLVITLCAASFAAIFIRFALNEGMNPLLIVASRLLLATLIYTPMVWKWHRPALAQMSRRTIVYSMASGIFLGLHFIAFSLSLQHTSILVNQVITNIGPIWVALLEMFLLKVRQPRAVWIGIFISFLGGMIIAFGNAGDVKTGADATFGTMLALVGSLLASIYMVIGRRVRSEVSFIPYVWIVFGTGAITAIVAAVISGVPIAGYTPKAYFWVLIIALVPQMIGHSGYNYLVGYFSATFISLVNLIVIITSAILAYILFREVPGLAHEIGSVVIIIGVALAVIGQHRADLLKGLWHKLKPNW